MATLLAFAVFFLSASPCVAIWLIMALRRAHLLVVSIISAFGWCLAIMLASIIWLAIPPLKQIYPWVLFISVTAQELLRLLLYHGFRFLASRGDGVEAFLRPGAKNEILTGMSVGVGFGLMSVLVNYYSILVDEFADNTGIYTDTCPINFFLVGALFALFLSILHILLGILVWPAYSDNQGWDKILLTYFLHLAVSQATLGNRRDSGCKWTLGLVVGLVSVSFALTIYLAQRRVRQETTD